MISPSRRLPLAAGAVVLGLLASSPAQAASDHVQRLRTDRPGAERALRAAQALAQGRGDGRDLSPALASLAGRAAALSAGDRAAANELLARPTDPGDTGQPGGPYTAPSVWSGATQHFCFNWVATTNDAPPMADADGDNAPDYIEAMADVFEAAYAKENADMGWLEPVSDGTTGGCSNTGRSGLTDVYVKDIGDLGLYGYASVDPGQQGQQRHAFLVMDDDYAAGEFPDYGGDPDKPVKVTAAHEYNHVIQYAYDILQDKWMFESTATWMEEKVFPDVDDYHQYLDSWSQRTMTPITRFGDGDKVYGSAVWNRWLDDEYDEDIVRLAWSRSVANDSFAPGAYDEAIRLDHGPGFNYELGNFAASTAAWHANGSGIHEGKAFPEVKRASVVLPADGSVVSGKLDHTGYAVFDVAKTSAPRLQLSGGLPAGVPGTIALVGEKGDSVSKILGTLPTGGQTSITLDNPGAFDRVSAVVVNGSAVNAGWSGQAGDWLWSHDQAPIQIAAKALSGGGTGNPGGDPDPGTGNPGGDDTGDGGGVIVGGGGIGGGGGGITSQPASLSVAAAKLPKLGKAKALVFKAAASQAGTFTATATVDARTAKRLGLGKKAVKVGAGKAVLAKAGSAKLTVRFTRKAVARFKKQRKPVAIAVKIAFKSAAGGSTARTVPLTLKR